MLDLIKRILEGEADIHRHLATYSEDSKEHSYCTIELVKGVPKVLFREPIPDEHDMETELGTLEYFIKQYSSL